MHKRIAHMVLIGGRQMPNFLTAQFLRPDVIVPIASLEAVSAHQSWSKIEPSLRQFGREVCEPLIVDAFDPENIREVCRAAVAGRPDTDWIFNLTCATTVMSIATYEVAKDLGITAWYLDTTTRRAVTLVGSPPGGNLFSVSISDYFKSYGRKIAKRGNTEPCAELYKLASTFADDPAVATEFQSLLARAVHGRGVRERDSFKVELLAPIQDIRKLCERAAQAGLISDVEIGSDDSQRFSVLGTESLDFLNGGWLELFVWQSVRDTGRFQSDELCYSFTIPADGAENELDFAATYAGALLIAECKAEGRPFKANHLEKLNSIAGLLGGGFVGKVFVTNQPIDQTNPAIRDFLHQAAARQIVVVGGRELHDVGNIICREAGAGQTRPTYPRG